MKTFNFKSPKGHILMTKKASDYQNARYIFWEKWLADIRAQVRYGFSFYQCSIEEVK